MLLSTRDRTLTRAVAVALALAPPALADDPLPLEYVRRPLALPRGVVSVDVGFALHREPTTPSALHTALSLGASWSPTSGVELSVVALPLEVAPQVAYGTSSPDGFRALPGVGARWQLSRGDVQVGLAIDASVLPRDPLSVVVEPSIPLRARSGRSRVDASLALRLSFGADASREPWLRVRYAYQLSPQFALGVAAGVVAPEFKGDEARASGGLLGVYTLAATARTPSADVSFALDFDRLLDATTPSLRTDAYTVSAGVRFFVP